MLCHWMRYLGAVSQGNAAERTVLTAIGQPGKTQKGIDVGCRHSLLESDIMHGQLGILDQARLSASNDSEQAGIGCRLVIGVLDQHSHFATDAYRHHRQPCESVRQSP
jgi:hypothetical protein